MKAQVAEPVSAMFDPDARSVDRSLAALAASTTVAEAERPAVAVYVEATTDAINGHVLTQWVAEDPDDEPVLLVGYNPKQFPRSVVDLIVAHRYGVPAEVVEVTL